MFPLAFRTRHEYARTEIGARMITAASIPPKPEHLDVHYEEDLIVARIRGAYDEAVAWYLESLFVDQENRQGYRFFLYQAREATTITHEARRLLAQWSIARRAPTAGAVAGASFATRTVAQMLIRAADLLANRPTDRRFFDTEAEARAWLDKQRPRLTTEARAKAT
jgi:hypothetical protein